MQIVTSPARTSLAGLTAVLAAIGAALWAVDQSVEFQNIPLTIFGLSSHRWIIGATFAAPLLLLLAASPLPDRLSLFARRFQV